MKFKLPKVEYTTLFSVASSIKAPAESKVTAAALIEKIQIEVQSGITELKKQLGDVQSITLEIEVAKAAKESAAIEIGKLKSEGKDASEAIIALRKRGEEQAAAEAKLTILENPEPEEINIELEQYELANLLLAFVELVKADDTKPQDINILRLLARSLRFSGGFKKELDKLMKTESTIELDPAIDLELDPE